MEINNKEEGLLAIGTTLANGKYRIEKYLSSGGFGKTYLATDTAFDEWVAIKELYIKGVCGRILRLGFIIHTMSSLVFWLTLGGRGKASSTSSSMSDCDGG